ncbi:MAG: thymidylate kinase [Bacilli bacterium]|nr:thymidylate kinase [Bacilli bacterium]
MEKGKLIVIEGACDGIGKSTQFKRLKERLTEGGLEVVSHHFPSYGTPQAADVEKYLSGEFGKPSELSPYFINELYAHDRKVTWDEVLKKEFDSNKVILLDRYTTSSLIYQSALISDEEEKKKFIDWVVNYEYKKLGIKEPDKVIFLTAPFDIVTRLRSERKDNEGVVNDIHEQDLDFMKKVYENANYIANYLNWDIIECSKNNQMLTIDEIHESIYQAIKK